MKQIKIKNMTDKRQAVAWIPSFDAGEEKFVGVEDAEVLLNNNAFQAVEQETKKAVKK